MKWQVVLLILLAGCIQEEAEMAKTVKIGIAGDTMLGRLVNEQISVSGYSYPWGDVLPLLKKNDINLINLETTLTKSEKKVPKVFNFKADPDKVQTLVEGNINVVSIANNHILDFNEEGLIETIKTLDTAKIKHVGAGMNEAEAREPVIIEKNNITIGIIGYTDNEPDWEAKDGPGTNYVKVGNIKKVKQDIDAIRNKVDILILTIHWGPNMREYPTKSFINFAHAVIDAGVDIFHGHSAHIFQGIERYNGKLILYDTGDFVDDYIIDPGLRNDYSFLYLIEVGQKGIDKIELVPVVISSRQVNLAEGRDYEQIIEILRRRSKQFGINITEDKGLFIK